MATNTQTSRSTHVRLDKEQYAKLVLLSEETGVPVTEMLRRMVAQFLAASVASKR